MTTKNERLQEQMKVYKRLVFKNNDLYRRFRDLYKEADQLYMAFYIHREEMEKHMDTMKEIITQGEQ